MQGFYIETIKKKSIIVVVVKIKHAGILWRHPFYKNHYERHDVKK